MQRTIGSALGMMLARVVLPAIFGPIGMAYFAAFVLVVFLLLVGSMCLNRYRLWRLRRGTCDDAIFYAASNRKALRYPEYTLSEMHDLYLLRGRNDLNGIFTLIRRLDELIRLDRTGQVCRPSSDDIAARHREMDRDAELRLYRA